MSTLELSTGHVDLERRRMWRDGAPVPLTTAEVRLLAYLSTNAGRSVSNDELLVHVFGYRPGLRSRTVATTIRRLRAKIERDPARPDHVVTVFGAGYRFEPVASAPSGPRLFGRLPELAELDRHGSGLLTVVGTAGVGKTRLVTEWLARGPGVFVDLSAATDRDGAVRLVAAALRLRLPPREGEVEAVAAAMGARGLRRVVLDNAEQLPATAAAVVGAWVRLVPDAAFVVTSRMPLRIAGERVMELRPLEPADAVALLVDCARRARPGGRFDETGALEDIVERLDRIPLAIEVAGARMAVMTPRELASRLKDRSGPTSLDATLRDAIAGSWELLGEAERRALSQLAIFPGGFSLCAAEAVVRLPDDTPVAEVLDRLRSRSLLRVAEPVPGELRFALYAPVRAFVAVGPADPEVGERLAEWCAAHGPAWVEHSFSADGAGGLASAPDEVDNLLVALREVEGRRPALAARIACVADAVLHRTGPLSTAMEVVERALALDLPSGLRAALLASRARLHRLTGRWALAEADGRAAVALGEAGGVDDPTRARAHFALAGILLETGQPEAAIAQCDAALARQACDPYVAAAAYGARAGARFALGRSAEACADYEEAARHAVHNNRHVLALVLANHGGVEVEVGRFDRALPLLLRSATLLEELGGYEGHLAHVHGNLAHLHLEQGQADLARVHVDRAKALVARADFRRVAPILLLTEATLEQELGRFDAALALVSEARSLLGGADPRYDAAARVLSGGVHHERGWLAAADDDYAAAVAHARATGDRGALRLALGRRAALLAGQGRVDEAAEALREARDGASDRALDALDVHEGHLDLALGRSSEAHARLARAAAPAPGDPAPSRSAWSSDVRLAVRLLGAATARAEAGMGRVFKVCGREEWAVAARDGAYRGSADDLRDGFVHLSSAHQLEGTLARHFAGREDLVLVAFEADDLGPALRFERSRGGDLFPHLYGALPTALARWVRPIGWDGRRHGVPATDER